MDAECKPSTSESVETLHKEAEMLKKRLEEERQKLNDVTCKCVSSNRPVYAKNVRVTVDQVAERLDCVNCPNIKPRRTLKGHQAKVLCSDWCPDKKHIVSSSQVSVVLVTGSGLSVMITDGCRMVK